MTKTNRKPTALATLPMEFVHTDHSVLAVLELEKGKTIALRFDRPEDLMNFCVGLMEEGKELWPEHPIFKMYDSEEEE